MDFSKSPRSVTPYFSEKHGAPEDEDGPAGADFSLTNPTLGPADAYGPSAPNPMSPSQPDPMPSLLAFTLNWNVPKARK